MPIVPKRPLTPSQRFQTANVTPELSREKPVKKLLEAKKRSSGRNVYGRITSRRRGGGHKRMIRLVDFRRDKLDMPAVVERIEYDPNRSAHLALVKYADGEVRYILAINGLQVGATIVSTAGAGEFNLGNSMPLRFVPPATKIHAIELRPNTKAQMARTAGAFAQLVSIDKGMATLKLPSGEIRMVNADCRCTMGEVGNATHSNQKLGKAGRNRWKGKRPRVRGVAMNPVDHPMGGGAGKTAGGGHPVSPWGQLSKGYPTRRGKRQSDKYIVVRRNGRKIRK
jgi:large subunit ribosomal protein L2